MSDCRTNLFDSNSISFLRIYALFYVSIYLMLSGAVDNYEVVDSSLDDIKKCLSPTFTAFEVKKLDYNVALGC